MKRVRAVGLLAAWSALTVTQLGCVEPTPRTITGRVLVPETSAPAGHAIVVIHKVHMPLPLSLPRITEVVRGETAEDGTFSLSIPRDKYLVFEVLGESCHWQHTRMRMDFFDLDAPLEILALQETCGDSK